MCAGFYFFLLPFGVSVSEYSYQSSALPVELWFWSKWLHKVMLC